MSDHDWRNEHARSLAVRLAGDAIDEVDERGRRIEGSTILILFNGHHERIDFSLPPLNPGQRWERLMDTARPEALDVDSPNPYPLSARSVTVFRTQASDLPESERISAELARKLVKRSRRT